MNKWSSMGNLMRSLNNGTQWWDCIKGHLFPLMTHWVVTFSESWLFSLELCLCVLSPCLCSWLEQDMSCPTCRMSLNISEGGEGHVEREATIDNMVGGPGVDAALNLNHLNHFLHFGGETANYIRSAPLLVHYVLTSWNMSSCLYHIHQPVCSHTSSSGVLGEPVERLCCLINTVCPLYDGCFRTSASTNLVQLWSVWVPAVVHTGVLWGLIPLGYDVKEILKSVGLHGKQKPAGD